MRIHPFQKFTQWKLAAKFRLYFLLVAVFELSRHQIFLLEGIKLMNTCLH